MTVKTILTKAFKLCHSVTSRWEGGWSNHKVDPGGKTMYGVTERVYHAWLRKNGRAVRPVRAISKAEALELYFEEYWLGAKCNTLFIGVDLAIYDAAVNSGVGRARKWLLASAGSDDHSKTVALICDKRLGFVQSLRIWKTFGKGWGRRIADIKATGMAWALEAQYGADTAMQRLDVEAQKSQKTSEAQTKSAGGVAVGSGAGGVGVESQLDPAAADQMAGWVLGGFVLFGLAVAGFLVIRAVLNAQQSRAFELEAEALVQ